MSASLLHTPDMHDEAAAGQWGDAVHGVGEAFSERVSDIVFEIAQELAHEIPEAGKPDSGLRRLLDQMAASNIDNVLSSMMNDLPAKAIRPTTASLELARRFGERGISPQRTVRVYQVGHRMLLRRILQGLADQLPDDRELIEHIAELVDWNFAYVNGMSQAAVEEHDRAQMLWSRTGGGATAQQVAHVLDSADDEHAAGDLLGYALDTTHVGMIIWSPTSTVTRQMLVSISATLRAQASVNDLLVVPLDLGTVMVWISVEGIWTPAISRLARDTNAIGDHVRIACGEVGEGLAGFRQTHQQALAARRVAELPGSRRQRITRYRDVAATSLLAMHPEEAAPWVSDLLGDLAEPGAEVGRLRETLRVYLETGENASNTALRMHLHRNTVKYRVARAMELLPVQFEQNRLSIALALSFHDRVTPPTT